MSEDRPEDKSDIPILQLPEGGFQSRIPASLLTDKSPEERDLYNDISKISSFVDWAAPMMLELNTQQRRTNGSVRVLKANVGEVDIKKLQRFNDMLSSWWVFLVGLLTIGGAMAGILSLFK